MGGGTAAWPKVEGSRYNHGSRQENTICEMRKEENKIKEIK
jgi:hypothetical protein